MLYVGLTNLLFFLRLALARQGTLRNQIYFLVLFLLFLFSAFRYDVGCDWSGYYYQYAQAYFDDWTRVITRRDPIWWFSLYQIRVYDLPYPVANVYSSLIFFAGVHVLARRQPDPLAFLILLFPILIINMPMSAIRQGAAIGLFCIALVAFIDRRPLWFGFWVVLASGFHSSVLLFMLLVPLAAGIYSRKRLVLAALLALPGGLLLLSGDSAELATTRYIETDRAANGALFRVGLLGASALYFFLFLRQKWQKTFPEDFSLAHIGAVAMVLSILLLPVSSIIADRFGYYLIPAQAFIFARAPFLPFRSSRALYSALPYAVVLLVFTVWTLNSRHFQMCYIPYNTWLFGFPGGDPTGMGF